MTKRRDALQRHGYKVLFLLGLAGLALAWIFSSTAKPFIGKPLTQADEQQPHSGEPVTNARAKELLVFLGFSGGGTRAAALAYGVLQELANTTIATPGGERRLLDEVDVISSVSGGSFTSAYFGLFGDRIFDSFKQDMLLRPIEDDLLKGVFNPVNWRDLASPYYGRSDLAVAYYDKHIFKGKTLGDIDPASSPWVIINASDIGTGDRLVFTRHVLDLLCNDFASYPVARAVAASSGVPGATTPIIMENRAGSCGYELPDWLREPLEAEQQPMMAAKMKSYLSYLDPDKRPWLHLVDGGITDNLGLRQFYEFSSLGRDFEQVISNFAGSQVNDVLIIAVNAAVEHRLEWARLPNVPSERQALGSMTHIEMRNYTADTLHMVMQAYRHWQEGRLETAAPAHFELVDVAFSRVSDDAQRAYLNALPTSLQLEEEQVDSLIEVGGQLLRDDPGFQRFLQRHQVASDKP